MCCTTHATRCRRHAAALRLHASCGTTHAPRSARAPHAPNQTISPAAAQSVVGHRVNGRLEHAPSRSRVRGALVQVGRSRRRPPIEPRPSCCLAVAAIYPSIEKAVGRRALGPRGARHATARPSARRLL